MEAAKTVRDGGVESHEYDAPESLLLVVVVGDRLPVHLALKVSQKVAPPRRNWRVILQYGRDFRPKTLNIKSFIH